MYWQSLVIPSPPSSWASTVIPTMRNNASSVFSQSILVFLWSEDGLFPPYLVVRSQQQVANPCFPWLLYLVWCWIKANEEELVVPVRQSMLWPVQPVPPKHWLCDWVFAFMGGVRHCWKSKINRGWTAGMCLRLHSKTNLEPIAISEWQCLAINSSSIPSFP